MRKRPPCASPWMMASKKEWRERGRPGPRFAPMASSSLHLPECRHGAIRISRNPAPANRSGVRGKWSQFRGISALHLGDLLGEGLGLLLQSLAEDEAGEAADGDVLADLGDGGVHH